MVGTRTEPAPAAVATLAGEVEAFAPADDGTRLYYRVAGEGPTVVLCDGILCDGFIWKYLRPALARRYRVIHWHYRGHGRSGNPRDPSRIDVPSHAADLHAVLRATGTERAVLMGHSMGTQVVLEAYRRDARRAAGLVLLCGSYGKITRTFHGTDVLEHLLPRAVELIYRHPVIARALWSSVPSELAFRVAKLMNEVDALRIRKEDLLPYIQHVSLMDPALFVKMLRAAGEHSAEDLLPGVRAPALVIAGERDTFTPTRLAEQMARQIPGAELLVVREGSHTAPIEQPELVIARVERFLAERAFSETPAAP